MNFFDQQARARSSSRRLVFLFILAVGLTVVMMYLAVAGLLNLLHPFVAGASRAPSGWLGQLAARFGAEGLWNGELFGWVTALVLTVMALGSSFKLWQLSRGGAAVAELLGGRLLDLHTRAPEERQLLNVVEEMAIASGLPVPDVYLLEEENSINAFAAGNTVSDAVIGVTFGALMLLKRDEMQGVIAHEFSHILNGDMRLNLRLIGWLHGILGLVVLGRVLMFSFLRRPETESWPGPPGRTRTGPVFHPIYLPAAALGCVCIAAGSIGAFFARCLKSAVSRQREYLADAAAVQFTRNPDGLTGALKTIGGLRWRAVMAAARAEEASHLYFADGMKPRWLRFTATHPPLTERIRRIKPDFDGKYPGISLERVLRESKVTALYREQAKPVDFQKLAAIIGPAAAAGEMLYADAARRSELKPPPSGPIPMTGIIPRPFGIMPAHLEYAALFLEAIPETLRTATSQPFSAVALVYGMLCSKDTAIRARQISAMTATTEPALIAELQRWRPLLDSLDAAAYLPLAALCLRALRQLSPPQFETFRANLRQLVEVDRQIDLFEYMLERMMVRHLDPHFRRVKRPPVQFYTLKPLLPDFAVLLSGLARVGHETETEAQAAFAMGATGLDFDPGLRFLPLAECNLAQMDAAMDRAAQAAPRLKQQLLAALANVAATDGVVRKREAELLRAIADALDMPVPPFLDVTNGAAT